jgi:hypothetical protein
MKNLSQDSRSPGRGLKPRPLEYEAGVLATLPRRSVEGISFVILRFCRDQKLQAFATRCPQHGNVDSTEVRNILSR